MKQIITDFINEYVEGYQARPEIATEYGKPMVGFANAMHPYIQSLPETISATHELPQNVLPDARTIIVYFVPFTRQLAKTNNQKTLCKTSDGGVYLASPEWARAYEETNAMFVELNQGLIEMIRYHGKDAAISQKAGTFNQQKLVSDWSHRHIAFAAGLGTFGMNNMLLTKHGCCGRYNTVITNLEIEPDQPLEEEYCLYKKNGSCGICMKNCPTGALSPEGFDRQKCYELCKINASVYRDFGSSYEAEDGSGANSVGSEVCGKCVTSSPCAFWHLKG